MEQAILRLLIREKLANGGLPHVPIQRTWGLPGQGETCDGCEGTVSAAQILKEGALDALGCGIRFHVSCFALWDAERQIAGHARSSPA